MHPCHMPPPIILPRKEFPLHLTILAILNYTKILGSCLVHSICMASQMSDSAESSIALWTLFRFQMISHVAAIYVVRTEG